MVVQICSPLGSRSLHHSRWSYRYGPDAPYFVGYPGYWLLLGNLDIIPCRTNFIRKDSGCWCNLNLKIISYAVLPHCTFHNPAYVCLKGERKSDRQGPKKLKKIAVPPSCQTSHLPAYFKRLTHCGLCHRYLVLLTTSWLGFKTLWKTWPSGPYSFPQATWSEQQQAVGYSSRCLPEQFFIWSKCPCFPWRVIWAWGSMGHCKQNVCVHKWGFGRSICMYTYLLLYKCVTYAHSHQFITLYALHAWLWHLLAYVCRCMYLSNTNLK